MVCGQYINTKTQNCLKPIDSNSTNIVANKLKFDFVQITSNEQIPNIWTRVQVEHAFLTDALTAYENEYSTGCQKQVYIKIDILNTTPAYDPTLRYGLDILV